MPNDCNAYDIITNTHSYLISIIVPVYNESSVIFEFHRRIISVINSTSFRFEIIYVNDGSTDNSLKTMLGLQDEDEKVAIIDLSRNFGKEIAMSAGLDYARGDAVVVIDADLQDPPELIPELIEQWMKGYDIVYGKRISRSGESLLKKGTAFVFYRIMDFFSHVSIPKDTGDFRILSRRAVDTLKTLREQHRFMKGLFAWIGFRQTAIPYERCARKAGTTKWNYWQLWNFALEGITSFTISPLKIASYVGILSAVGAFVYASVIIFKTLVRGDPVAGYPSLMVVILFIGGIQLISIGIIGEYIGRIFNETKKRPLY